MSAILIVTKLEVYNDQVLELDVGDIDCDEA